jgi:hypothetical protein
MNMVEKSGLCLFIMGAIHLPDAQGLLMIVVSIVIFSGLMMFFCGKEDD